MPEFIKVVIGVITMIDPSSGQIYGQQFSVFDNMHQCQVVMNSVAREVGHDSLNMYHAECVEAPHFVSVE